MEWAATEAPWFQHGKEFLSMKFCSKVRKRQFCRLSSNLQKHCSILYFFFQIQYLRRVLLAITGIHSLWEVSKYSATPSILFVCVNGSHLCHGVFCTRRFFLKYSFYDNAICRLVSLSYFALVAPSVNTYLEAFVKLDRIILT